MEYVFEQGFCDAETRDKNWIEYGLALATGAEPIPEFERVKQCVADCTASKTKAELLSVAMERKILMAPIATIEEVANSEQLAHREFFQSLDSPAEGDDSALAYPGAFAKFSATPLHISQRAPRIGEHTEEVISVLSGLGPIELPTGPTKEQPLAGLKVLDFMWALAGPGATRILADFGATVVARGVV